jgi:hypothetical protein
VFPAEHSLGYSNHRRPKERRFSTAEMYLDDEKLDDGKKDDEKKMTMTRK